jgi:hypothetical protein
MPNAQVALAIYVVTTIRGDHQTIQKKIIEQETKP